MTASKIYTLRRRSGHWPMPPRAGIVVPSQLLEQLVSHEASGTPLYGSIDEHDERPLLRVSATEPATGLIRLGRAWAHRDCVDLDRLDPGEVALIADSPPRATWDGDPLHVTVLDPARYRDRVRALPGADALLGRTVVLVGLGSVGSDLGARLVRLGVRVVGCDPDVLSVENLIRWCLPVAMDRHVGRTKADVWRERLRDTVPEADVEAHAIDVVRDATRFDAIVASEHPALLVVATDTADSRRVINSAAARYGVGALYVALADGAASVRIESVPDARRGPCHLCAEVAEGIAPSGFGGTQRSRTPYAADTAAGSTAAAALPVDVAIGTALATRIAVVLLTGGDVSAYFTRADQRGNVLFVSLHPRTWVFEEAWDRLVYQVEPAIGCPVCGEQEDDDEC